MKRIFFTVVFAVMFTLFGSKAFSQVEFEIQNTSGFQLYGLFVSQDGGADWTEDLLTTSEFPSGTSFLVTIPESYTCEIYIKVSYQVDGVTYEELLARANVCEHGGIKILANPNGSSGKWMITQYLN